jgi:hypothetical protein
MEAATAVVFSLGDLVDQAAVAAVHLGPVVVPGLVVQGTHQQ